MQRAGAGPLGLTIIISLALTLVLFLASDCPAQGEARLSEIKMPPGFRIALYARVPEARSLELSPSGVLYVWTRSSRVYAVTDENRDFTADRVLTLASGLNQPKGVPFCDCTL